MSPPFHIQGRTDVGRQRQQNEDSYRILERPDGSWVLVVCDGMGGHEAGEVASAVACQRITEVLGASAPAEPPRAIYDALVEANRAVREASVSRGAAGMGTTAVVAWVIGHRCYVGWVGDSRLYHLRGGQVVERSRDHTRVEEMVQYGIITAEQAREHPDAHILVRALGGSAAVQQSFRPEVWNEPLDLRTGDGLLLCSDGLYDFIDDDELYRLIERRDCATAADHLVRTANERGGADNITVILLFDGVAELPAGASVATAPTVRRDTLKEAAPSASLPTESPRSVPPSETTPRPRSREALPETPLVSLPVATAGATDAPHVEQRGLPASQPGPGDSLPVERRGLPATQPAMARYESPPMSAPHSSSGMARDERPPMSALRQPSGGRQVPATWAFGAAAGTLLLGAALGWFLRGGAERSDPVPMSALAASASTGAVLVLDAGTEPVDASVVEAPSAVPVTAIDAGSADGAVAPAVPAQGALLAPDAGSSADGGSTGEVTVGKAGGLATPPKKAPAAPNRKKSSGKGSGSAGP